MNTPVDTDEHKAKPSVWPVYVAAAVVLITSVGLALLGGGILLAAEDLVGQFRAQPEFSSIFLAVAAWGLFGVVAAIGMLRLRGWGWWCGSLFAGVWLAGSVLALLGTVLAAFPPGRVVAPRYAPTDTTVFLSAGLVVAFLLLGVLGTRRRLFFPPKAEGEE